MTDPRIVPHSVTDTRSNQRGLANLNKYCSPLGGDIHVRAEITPDGRVLIDLPVGFRLTSVEPLRERSVEEAESQRWEFT